MIDGGGSLESALVGDLIAASAVANGWAGSSCTARSATATRSGCCRSASRRSGSNPRKSAKDGVGEVDVEVVIAGVRFAPGRHVWADADGVLVERTLDST